MISSIIVVACRWNNSADKKKIKKKTKIKWKVKRAAVGRDIRIIILYVHYQYNMYLYIVNTRIMHSVYY